ncbi:MAG: UDP-2,3-diacylglucosamine diphosphatase [Agarilytica sp.]
MPHPPDISEPHRQVKAPSFGAGFRYPGETHNTYRSIFISDVHLGTKDCKAHHLSEFLKFNACEQLYLVGDIFDGWRMKSGVYWHKSFNRVIRHLLKLSKTGTPVYYVTGNHDEFLRKYANNAFDNIHIVNRITHTCAKNKRYLVIHGDQFEGVTRCSIVLKYIGDVGYEFLMLLNRAFNILRARWGYGYWSFAAFLKTHIKRAKEYIHDYEAAVSLGAKKQGFDGVICGHIHQAAQKDINGIAYLNTGDWVESCTAVVEDFEGNFKLVYWLKSSTHIQRSKRKQFKNNPHTCDEGTIHTGIKRKTEKM